MSEIISVGIDPGLKGGIAFYKGPGASENNSYELPLTSNKKEIDAYEVYSLLNYACRITENVIVTIEKAQAMPKQGVVGVFNYGRGYGELVSALKILQLPYQEIKSQKWKKEFSLINKGKKESVTTAEKLDPTGIYRGLRGGLLDGKAEAMLIAIYGRRKEG